MPRSETQMPLVLFSSPECRAIAVDLRAGETMGDHRVRERAVVQIVTGRVTVDASGETVACDAGTLITFEPNETHSVHAHEEARLLLILAPWPAPKHYTDGELAHDDLPDNAMADPMGSTDAATGARSSGQSGSRGDSA
ncbi:MAG TPA: AraC family ligand binding domain-containing protein [Gaiella sp.]|nr:AraC family ligand binding domain-containing protein [Gaiella sp.]